MLKAVPMELKEANAFVDKLHRHHSSVHRDKFRIGCECNGKLVGVIQLARPVSRVLDDGKTIEVVRLCTDGTKNVCSYLYSKAARIAKEMGYSMIITYILETEDGASLRASGWHKAYDTKGHSWDCPSRPRQSDAPTCNKQCYVKILKNGR
ncbi:MAG: XF1762 family protein [Oscillospiraceae bacterium]